MRRLPFVKMSGAGNDFILLQKDWLGSAKVPAARLAKRLCLRRRSIGADGLLIVSRSGRLSYHNADGSAAFCANGSRCAAWWLLQT
ncbi:MAG: diaminopimelate epimerase, partial [Elusimicrobia bacterium]|nr:diaminopimelate epimerase [Elusimicrobiota bacterium]